MADSVRSMVNVLQIFAMRHKDVREREDQRLVVIIQNVMWDLLVYLM